MRRPTFTALQRATIFRDASGVCHICSRKIAEGESWHIEHVKARALQGSDSADNLRPAHVDCHAGKTRRERTIIAKADRALKRHAGIKRSSRPMAGSRATKWKRRIDGRTELR